MFLIRSGIPSLDTMFHPTNWTAADEGWPVDDCSPQLVLYEPDNSERLTSFLHDARTQPEVAFIDLASRTGGDDWGFTERLLALIPAPKSGAPRPRDIVVIDAMEGMETLTGEV